MLGEKVEGKVKASEEIEKGRTAWMKQEDLC